MQIRTITKQMESQEINKKMVSRRIVFLDYMRIIAFTIVILGHKFNKDLYALSSDASNHITLRWFYGLLADASIGGAMGVVVFFLVSGYIITHVLQSESTIEFYLKRIFRIYPLYITAVLIEILAQHSIGLGTPPISQLIPRLLLIGDFFNTPLALMNVEWTLRIEILFYLFMGIIKQIGLIKKGNALSVLLLVVTLIISKIKPLPIATDFHYAYLTLYAPFLFIGVIVYLSEHRLTNTYISLASIATIFYIHLSLTERISTFWAQYNYALIGMAIFILSCIFKDKFVRTKICILLSEMTYSIYLFHNWTWDYLLSILKKVGLPYVNINIQVLTLLFVICYIANKTIEKQGVATGRFFLHKLLTSSNRWRIN